MKINLKQRFIVVDDDTINATILTHYLKKNVPEASEIHSFTNPLDGIEFISNYPFEENDMQTILFLDINMPEITGWDFLERIKKMEKRIIKQLKIFILSSSTDKGDIKKAKRISLVQDYISKPFTNESLEKVFGVGVL